MVRRWVLALVMMTGAGVGPAVADDLSSYDTVMICKGDTLFAVPAHPGIRIKGISVSTLEEDRDNPRWLFWKNGDSPLRVTGFTINALVGFNKTAPPILDLLLGRASEYRIVQLRIGAFYEGDLDDWTEESRPSDLPDLRELPGHNVDRMDSYLRQKPTLFEFPLKFRCSKGLPIYSDDSETYHCGAFGILPDGTRFIASYDTGRDLPGHWPNVDQPTSDWEAPIAELEEALGNIVVAYGPGNRVCD